MFILIGVLFLTASSVYADTSEEYNSRGFTYYKQGNLTQAISEYAKAIEINPNYRDAYINRGNAYCNQGKFAQAISDFTKATEIDKKSLEAYSNRSQTGIEFVEFDGIEQIYLKNFMDLKAELV